MLSPQRAGEPTAPGASSPQYAETRLTNEPARSTRAEPIVGSARSTPSRGSLSAKVSKTSLELPVTPQTPQTPHASQTPQSASITQKSPSSRFQLTRKPPSRLAKTKAMQTRFESRTPRHNPADSILSTSDSDSGVKLLKRRNSTELSVTASDSDDDVLSSAAAAKAEPVRLLPRSAILPNKQGNGVSYYELPIFFPTK